METVKKVLAVLLSTGVVAGSAEAQASPRRVEIVVPDRPIAVLPELALIEPHPAVDPTNPRHILIGAIAATPGDRGGRWTCVVLTSFDRGSSWTHKDLEVNRCIDPWVVFTEGAVLATAIELGRDGAAAFRLLGRRSEDGGRTWDDTSIVVGAPHDHPIIVRARDGSLLLTSRRDRRSPSGRPRHAIYLGRSHDGGRTFEDVAEIITSNVAQNATGLAEVEDSLLVLSYWDFARDVDGFDRRGALARGRSWVLRSRDGGRTFSEPFLVTDECASGGPSGAFPGYPFLTSAPEGGRFSGRLYHVCVRPELDGVVLSHSTDGGERWSDPVRVDGAPVANHTRTPMAAVNNAGVVGVAWYDRRHHSEQRCQHMYFTASTDGGHSVIEPRRVSEVESCPEGPGNDWVANSWPIGGDYSSLVAGPDDAFYLIWSDSRTGRFALRLAVLTVVQ